MHPMAPQLHALSSWAALVVSIWSSGSARAVKRGGRSMGLQAAQLPGATLQLQLLGWPA